MYLRFNSVNVVNLYEFCNSPQKTSNSSILFETRSPPHSFADKLLNDKNMKTKKIIQILLLGLLAYPLYAQQTEIKVSGKVTDINNETLEGVTSLSCLKSREDSLLFSVNI